MLTQVFTLQSRRRRGRSNTNLKPFLSAGGASSFAVPEQGLLVVTDYATQPAADRRRRSESIDQPAQDVGGGVLPGEARRRRAADAAGRADPQGAAPLRRRRACGGAVEVTYDARTSQVAVIGPAQAMDGARGDRRVARRRRAGGAEPRPLLQAREHDGRRRAGDDPGAGRRERRSPDAAGDSLAAPLAGEQGRRESATDEPRRAADGGQRRSTPAGGDRANAERSAPVPRAARRSARPRRGSRHRGLTTSGDGARSHGVGEAIRTQAGPHHRRPEHQQHHRHRPAGRAAAVRAAHPPARQAPPAGADRVHRSSRSTPPATSQLGVEIGRQGGTDDNQVITFSSVRPQHARPDDRPAVADPGPRVQRGADQHRHRRRRRPRAGRAARRATVSSAPRILVNDNNTGTLSSVTEFPYASVNASDTVATTSFGDYSKAGTEITVRPHISESDYLQLEYSVSLSSFTGEPIAAGRHAAAAAAQERRDREPGDDPRRLDDHRRRAEHDELRSRRSTACRCSGGSRSSEYLFSSRIDDRREHDAVRVHPPGDPARRQVRGPEVPLRPRRPAPPACRRLPAERAAGDPVTVTWHGRLARRLRIETCTG